MILSRMELDTTKPETMMALAAPSRFHGAVEQSFPGEKRRRLWRLDNLRGRLYLLLLSEDAPDLTHAVEQFGFLYQEPMWETRSYDPFLDRVECGTRWRFRLVANPTVSRSREGERGRVYAHITPFYQKQWLLERSERHGFSLAEKDVQVVQSRWQRFMKGGKRQVSLLAVTYEGVLTVTDPDLMRATLTEGIGRGKAYGMGLLTLTGVARHG